MMESKIVWRLRRMKTGFSVFKLRESIMVISGISYTNIKTNNQTKRALTLILYVWPWDSLPPHLPKSSSSPFSSISVLSSGRRWRRPRVTAATAILSHFSSSTPPKLISSHLCLSISFSSSLFSPTSVFLLHFPASHDGWRRERGKASAFLVFLEPCFHFKVISHGSLSFSISFLPHPRWWSFSGKTDEFPATYSG